MAGSLLNWPSGLERTPPEDREKTSKFSSNFRRTQSDLKDEMRLMDVEEWRLDDVTGSGGDPGVVLRWIDNGNEYAVACDHYEYKKSNLRSVYLYVKETRKRNDRPVETANDEFAAARLPAGDEDANVADGRSDHEVLGVSPDASDDEIKAAYREKIKELDPDKPEGDEDEFVRVRDAKERLIGGS